MEDALARTKKLVRPSRSNWSLNPCFNGRCTRTSKLITKNKTLKRLNPCFNGRCTRTLMVIRGTTIQCLS